MTLAELLHKNALQTWSANAHLQLACWSGPDENISCPIELPFSPAFTLTSHTLLSAECVVTLESSSIPPVSPSPDRATWCSSATFAQLSNTPDEDTVRDVHVRFPIYPIQKGA